MCVTEKKLLDAFTKRKLTLSFVSANVSFDRFQPFIRNDVIESQLAKTLNRVAQYSARRDVIAQRHNIPHPTLPFNSERTESAVMRLLRFVTLLINTASCKQVSCFSLCVPANKHLARANSDYKPFGKFIYLIEYDLSP